MSSSHKDKKPDRYLNHCKTCGSHDSACDCKFKSLARKKTKPLTSDCVLVDSIVCCKTVQKTAEYLAPFAIGPVPATLAGGVAALTAIRSFLLGLGFTLPDAVAFANAILAGSVSLRVRPDFNNIEQEITVVPDKIINLGFIPTFLELRIVAAIQRVPIRIYFQEHTDCPGVCPGDTVTETDLVPEAILDQDLIQFENGNLVANFLLFKAILRTTITATRQVLVDPNTPDCHRDVNENRCDPTETPATINFPRPS